jgi:hypothetical protein
MKPETFVGVATCRRPIRHLPFVQSNDLNLMHFLVIFGKKIGVFLKNQSYDQIFALLSFVLSKNAIFGKNIKK